MSIDDPKASYEKSKNQGNEAFKLKKFPLAIKCYTEAIEAKPDESVAYSNRAICHINLKKYFDAYHDCNRALELDPKAVKAYYRRATALRELHRYQRALDDFKEVLKLDPEFGPAKKEIDTIEGLLKLDTRIELRPFEKPVQFQSDKAIKTSYLLNQYTGAKMYDSRGE